MPLPLLSGRHVVEEERPLPGQIQNVPVCVVGRVGAEATGPTVNLVTSAAEDRVCIIATAQQVSTCATRDDVIALFTKDHVAASIAVQRVVTGLTMNPVVA